MKKVSGGLIRWVYMPKQSPLVQFSPELHFKERERERQRETATETDRDRERDWLKHWEAHQNPNIERATGTAQAWFLRPSSPDGGRVSQGGSWRASWGLWYFYIYKYKENRQYEYRTTEPQSGRGVTHTHTHTHTVYLLVPQQPDSDTRRLADGLEVRGHPSP